MGDVIDITQTPAAAPERGAEVWPRNLPMTVSEYLVQAWTARLGMDSAVSYLCGAVVIDASLRPWTTTGWQKINGMSEAKDVLRGLGITLGQPLPEKHRMLIPAVEDLKAAKKSKW